MDNKIIYFDSGLKLIHKQMQGVRSVAIGVMVAVGSVSEKEQNNGISHFIEHMMFKGTSKRSAFDIVCEIDGLGAQVNAYTSKQSTCYYTISVDEVIFCLIPHLTKWKWTRKRVLCLRKSQ